MDISPASSPEEPAPDWLGRGPTGRAERRLAILDHLAGVGVRLAEVFAEKAVTDANTAWIEPECHVDPGIPFSAMARTVRQTLALQVKFEKEDRLANAAQTVQRDSDRRARRSKRRALVKSAVADIIRTEADPTDNERLLRDLEERLHDEEADERFDDGPVRQVVAKLCKALGLSIDLSLFEDEDVPAGKPERHPHRRPEGRAASPQPPMTRPSGFKPDAPPSPGAKPPGAHPLADPPVPSMILPGGPDPRPGPRYDHRKPLAEKIDPLPD